MPKEETIELRHVRGVIGEKGDPPSVNPRSSLMSVVRYLMLKVFNVPQLGHLYATYRPDTSVALAAGENDCWCLFSDGTYLYAGLQTAPGTVVKIDLETFTRISAITFNAGLDNVNSLVSDGTYLYAALSTSPATIVRIDLATFTISSTLVFVAGNDLARSLSIDGSYLYVVCQTVPGRVVKVDLTTFTQVDMLLLAVNNPFSSYLAPGFLYVGTLTAPGSVVRIDLSTFLFSSTLTFGAGYNNVYSLISDGTYLYAGLGVNPGRVIKIDPYSLSIVSAVTYAALINWVYSMFTDGSYLYTGLTYNPCSFMMISLEDMSVNKTVRLQAGNAVSQGLFSDGTYLYVGLNTSPAIIWRVYILPGSDYHQKKLDTLHEQLHSGTYSVYPLLAAGTLVTSGAAAWTKGAVYTQVVPASTITTTFYITGVVLYGLLANTNYEVDIATGGAGSESVIATVSHQTDNTNLAHECLFPVPIKVASNTRVAARCADAVGGNTCNVKIRYKT